MSSAVSMNFDNTRIAGNFRVFQGQSSQRENKNWEKLPRTGISHAKLVMGVVSLH